MRPFEFDKKLTRKILLFHYSHKRMSITQIAKLFKCSKMTISLYMRKFKIKPRNRSLRAKMARSKR